jgi:L-ascorbate metabolism protein UlaG (beta-lactamase superfamily)
VPAATLDWLGCATFRLTVADLVVFLDAYIDRVPSAPPVGVTTGDVERADWIVVGHSHFDHLWGAETIARNTGARILASWSNRVCRRSSCSPSPAVNGCGSRPT